MLKTALAFLSLFVFLNPSPSFAANPPQLSEPTNNSQTQDKSPKLSWQYSEKCPDNASCFKVDIAKSENFAEIEKSTYTNNTNYSPTLSEGTWFWKVKAKNEQEQWSDYSATNKFTITNSQNNPQQTAQPTASPELSKSSPTPSSTAKKTQSFTISTNQNSIDNENELSITTEITALDPSTTYYLKAAFYKEGSTNYFGQTKVNDSWIKNNATYSTQLSITTNNEGNWQGTLNIKNDPEDNGFSESGSYLLKVGRYNNKGTGPTWSNTLPISLNAQKPTSQGGELTDDPSPTPSASTNETVSTNNLDYYSSEINTEDSSPSAEPNFSLPENLASVAGVATEASVPKELVRGEKYINWWFISSGTILVGLAGGYLAYKRRTS